MSSIGYSGDTLQDCSKLSYHCIKFGRYARCASFKWSSL